jgi:hypothetical protein
MTSEEPRPTTPTMPFSSDPAGISLGEGLSVAARYWRASIDLWSLPVAIVAAVAAVATWAVASLAPVPPALPTSYVPGMDLMALIGPFLPQFLVGTFVTGTATMLAGWVYVAIAVAGLRGYRVMPGWILRRGVRSFGADLLLTVAFAAVFALLGLLSMTGGPGLVLVVMVTAFVPAIYVSIRLALWSLAIFDGADIVEGFHATWGISRGAVARMLGWGLLVAVIGLVVRGTAELVTTPLGDANPVRAGIVVAVTEAFAAYSMMVLAVIYESQRRRRVLRSPVPTWSAPMAGPAWTTPAARPADPAAPPPPLDPPPPPPPPEGWR